MNRIFGYVRVSTKEQNEERQIIALSAYSIPPGNLFLDKQSGKDFERPAYLRLLRRLRKGDLLVVKSIDRLGRDYEEIMVQWKRITKEIGAEICVVDMPLLDTRREKDLLGTFISDLVLQVLSFVSQTEREFIRQRQAEGIAAARKRGVRFGRPVLQNAEQILLAVDDWKKREKTAREAAETLHVSVRTFYNYVKKYEK